jgi:hypothetical protein
MNLKDEIVDEVRAVREAYAARFNFDLAEMYKDLKAKEKRHGRMIAPLEPVQPQPVERVPE